MHALNYATSAPLGNITVAFLTDLKAPVALPPLVDDSTDTEDASDDGNSGPEHMRLASFSS